MKIERSFPDKLKDHIENLESYIYEAEAQGYRFIELRHLRQCSTQDVIIGVEELKIKTARKPGERFAVTAGVTVIGDGVLRFLPDKRLYRWGYLLDTPRNRKWLAAQYSTPQVMIADSKIDEEIRQLALELGFGIEKKEIDLSFDNYLSKKEDKVDVEKEELLRKIEELEKQLEPQSDDKPLAGKRVTKK